MIHQVNLEMGDTVVVELFQSTSVERRNIATVTLETPGLIVIATERYEEDLKVVATVE